MFYKFVGYHFRYFSYIEQSVNNVMRPVVVSHSNYFSNTIVGCFQCVSLLFISSYFDIHVFCEYLTFYNINVSLYIYISLSC